MSNKTSRAQLTMLAETLRNAGYDAYEKNSTEGVGVRTSRVVALGSSAGYARLVVHEQRGHKTETNVYFSNSTLDRKFDNVDDAIRYFARTLRSTKPGLSAKTRDYPHHGEGERLPLPNPAQRKNTEDKAARFRLHAELRGMPGIKSDILGPNRTKSFSVFVDKIPGERQIEFYRKFKGGYVVDVFDHSRSRRAADAEVVVRRFRTFGEAEAYVLDVVRTAVYGRAKALRMREKGEYRLPLPNPTVMPIPADKLHKFKLPETPGGLFLEKGTLKNLTGRTYANGFVDVTGPRPDFFTNEPESALRPKIRGVTLFKVNLFRKSRGWKWIGGDIETAALVRETGKRAGEPDPVIVSVEKGSSHHYALRVEFAGPVLLATYPKKKSEPRLRPTTRSTGKDLGKVVGHISVRKKRHPVYDRIVLR